MAGTAAVEHRDIYRLPGAADGKESVAGIVFREFTVVEIVEHAQSDDIPPTAILIEGNDVAVGPNPFEFALHDNIGLEIVEPADAYTVCHRRGVLTIEVDTGGEAHLCRREIMKARHIVVAIGTERLVVGIALMDGTAHGIDAVDAPRQAL